MTRQDMARQDISQLTSNCLIHAVIVYHTHNGNRMHTFVEELKTAIAAGREIAQVPETNAVTITTADAATVSFDMGADSGVPTTTGGDDNDGKSAGEYDVKSVFFCWTNRAATVTEYIELCESAGSRVISFMERTRLIAYLQGEVDSLVDAATSGESGVADVGVQRVADAGVGDESKSEKRGSGVVDYKEVKKRKIENDPLLKEISLHEVDLVDHDKALRGTQGKNVDFANLIRECEYKIVRPLKQTAKDKGKSVTGGAGGAGSGSGAGLSKSKTAVKSVSKSSSSSSSGKVSSESANSLAKVLHKKDPIIILSPSAISMLTMQNAKSFLQDGKFVDAQTIENTTGAMNMVQIVRQSKRFNRKIKFVVVSNVEKFFVKPEYWDRVVAVFTTGQEWQFKNYKINQPNLLFQKVKGFYVNYNGDIVPNNIKNWNVEVIALDRNQRFRDRQISELMWESIERFMFSKGYK